MLLFNELYTMGMPLLVPERRWMHQLAHHALTRTARNWWHLRADAAGGALPQAAGRGGFPLPHPPWIGPEGRVGEVSYWYELSDFARFPCVTYFGSVPGMLARLQELDVPRLRAGMRSFNRATLRDSLAFYRAAAGELLADGVASGRD